MELQLLNIYTCDVHVVLILRGINPWSNKEYKSFDDAYINYHAGPVEQCGGIRCAMQQFSSRYG